MFCPDCSYTLDIEKNTGSNKHKKIIKNINDIFKLLDSDKLNEYTTSLPLSKLTEHKKYKKLTEEEKNTLSKLFKTTETNIRSVCNNCGYTDELNESFFIHTYNKDDTTNLIRSLEENKLICMSPTLPRTRAYNCVNSNCITHKKPELKEAVFTRIPGKFNLEYICTVCNYSWN